MKRLLFGTAIALALGAAGSAAAADLPARTYTKAPEMVAPIYDWSGFYVGINGGGGFSHKCWDLNTPLGVNAIAVPPGPEGCHDASGATVGGQIGYRWQSAAWVFGLEAQGNWADFRGDNISLAIPTDSNQSRIDAFGLFTGQVGYAWNNTLVYVKGGAAVTSDRLQDIRYSERCSDRHGRRDPLGCGGRCRLRIWHRPELVGRLRVRSPVHGQPRRQLYGVRRDVLRHRSYRPGCRSVHSRASTTNSAGRWSRATDVALGDPQHVKAPASAGAFVRSRREGRLAYRAGAPDGHAPRRARRAQPTPPSHHRSSRHATPRSGSPAAKLTKRLFRGSFSKLTPLAALDLRTEKEHCSCYVHISGGGHVEGFRGRGGGAGVDRVVRRDDRGLGAIDPPALKPPSGLISDGGACLGEKRDGGRRWRLPRGHIPADASPLPGASRPLRRPCAPSSPSDCSPR